MSRHSAAARPAHDGKTRVAPARSHTGTGGNADFVAQGAAFWSQVRILTERSLKMSFSDRKLVIFGLLQPVLMLLLFSQLFGKSLGSLKSIAGIYTSYANFIVPATLVNIGMTTAMSSSAGVITEVFTGFIGRLRVMPVNLFTVLIARTTADTVRLVAQLIVATVMSVILLDFRPKGGVVGVSLALLLITFFGWGLGWLFIAISTWARKPETIQVISFIVTIPLMFGSTAFVPPSQLPTWLRYVAKVNPLSYAIDACRALAFNLAIGNKVWLTLGLVSAVAVIGIRFSSRNFQRAS